MLIVIIDDNSTVLLTLEAKLKASKAIQDWDTLYKFRTADEFIKHFRFGKDNDYGIVICDHDLGPDQMKGYEVINLIQKEGYKNKAILFTADDSTALNIKMTFKRHVDYVVKSNERGENDSSFILSKLIAEARDLSS